MRVGVCVTEAESYIDFAEWNSGEYEHFRIVRSILNTLATAVDSGMF